MIVIPKNITNSYSSDYDSESYTYTNQQIPESIQKKIQTLFYYLESKNDIPSLLKNHVIPPGLLYADDNLFIYEKPPCLKNYFYINSQVSGIEDQEPEVYTIPLPWQVYIVFYSSSSDSVYISDIYMYFSNSSIVSFDQPVYLAPLTNFYSNGLLCRPMFGDMQEITPKRNDVESLIELSYNWVWNSGFNADLTESMLQVYIHSYARKKPLFPNLTIIPFDPTSSYYLQSSSHADILKCWQNLSLEEVLNVQWFPPSRNSRYINDFSNFLSSTPDGDSFAAWLTRTYPQNSSYESECCGDCQYYDEDGNHIDGMCAEDGQCSCHELEHNYDQIYAYLNEKNFFDNPYSLREILESILNNRLSAISSANVDFLNNYYTFAI